MRGGSVGVQARIPEPASGVVQSGDGGAEKGLLPLGVGATSGGLERCSWPVSLHLYHIPGDSNAWGDLLSGCVSVPALPVRAVAVFSPCDQDDSMPSKAVVRQAQQKALATDGTEGQSFESAVGLAILDDEGLIRIHARDRHVLWIPDSDKQLQVRLMICAHMRDAGVV